MTVPGKEEVSNAREPGERENGETSVYSCTYVRTYCYTPSYSSPWAGGGGGVGEGGS